MDHFGPLRTLVEDELGRIDLPEQPANLYDPIRYMLRLGGKRIRPALVILAAQQYAPITDSAMPLAAAIEVFHNFTLMHDDIMDQAPLRRGVPTVHHKWDTTIAILSGDAMMVKAYEYLSQCEPEVLLPSLRIFNKTALEVCEGQQMDMDFESALEVSLDRYLEMIRLKTAVLLGCSLQLGAIAGRASHGDQQALYDFGVNLGVAFQIKDDLLDCFGDSQLVGKQTGGDILSNKKTFLLIKALSDAQGDQRAELAGLIGGSNNAAPDKVSRVTHIYRALGVDQYAQTMVDHYTREALNSLHMLSVAESSKQVFRDLASALLERQR